MKHIRRCLKPQKVDPTPLASTAVASATVIATAIKGAFPVPAAGNALSIAWWIAWILIPSILAAGAVAVAYMRYASAVAAQTDEHLKAAQDEADRLIAMQASAQAALDQRLVQALAEAATAHQRLLPASSLMVRKTSVR